MTDIKLYCADCTGVAGNTSYPHAAVIRDAGSLRTAVAHDYVTARFRGSYRSLANFIEANCLCKDCDNDHSDEPDDWVTPEHALASAGQLQRQHFCRFADDVLQAQCEAGAG